MPLIRVPGHHFDAPVDHADGRRGRLPVSGAVANGCTHGGRAQGEGTVAAVTHASRGLGERMAFGLGNAGASPRTIQVNGREDAFLAGWASEGFRANGGQEWVPSSGWRRLKTFRRGPPSSWRSKASASRSSMWTAASTPLTTGGPLSEGELEGEVVTCPWHRSTFNVTTGAVLSAPARDGVSHYSVRDSGGEVSVEV
jgi:hypothetical protein